MNKRQLKDLLFEQVARLGKAASSPKRLELLELLAQGEKSVEALAAELSIPVKLASSHLRVLREARMVSARKDGKFVLYSLAGADVASLWVAMREVAQEHLVELRVALEGFAAGPDALDGRSREQLMEQARRGEVVVIDVRPRAEFNRAHLPFARSMPLDEVAARISELPEGAEVVAYCRGPFCMFADEAVALLRANGRDARKLSDGVAEWRRAGMRTESKESA